MSQSTKRLVIVESPTKAKTIRKFLPRQYHIEASMGHVRDLPASASEIPKDYKDKDWARLGINIQQDFEPLYVVPSKKKKVVKQLKDALKGAEEVYIATDEDREGESIGWHLVNVLQPKVPIKRMVFHEITEEAILNALNNTRDIDNNLVEAQETRRVLDRLVGYGISPVLWRKIAPRLSAGRVQSVAVRLLVLREKERIAFVPASYWDLKAQLSADKAGFEATMTHLDRIRLASGKDFDDDTGKLKANLSEGKDVLLLAEERARTIAASEKDRAWQVTKIEERQQRRSPAAPFTTSTLQQEASRKLSLSAKRTMQVAQGLYENGYITYMRTDSTNLSNEAISASRKAIEARYGREYLSPKPRQYSKSARNAQEAHEAIRPAGKDMKTAQEHGLSDVEARLYDLIWKRTVASQMAEAQLKFTTATLDVKSSEGQATFRASGRSVIFPGFFRAYVEGSDDPEAALDDRDQPLPDLKQNDTVDCQKVEAVGHETKAPARFTEASLVKVLEQEGIGRPSTYASIIDTIQNRGYVRKQGSQLVPTFTAFATNNLLEQQFEKLVDIGFTATMEEDLDSIAEGDIDAAPYLRQFYLGQEGLEQRIEEGLETIDARAVSELNYPQWGYTVRVGRYGPYVESQRDGERITVSLPENLSPADITPEELAKLLEQGANGDDAIGSFPVTQEPIYLRQGPYGPYVQLGEAEGKKKPKRTSLPKGMEMSEVTETIAIDLLSLPRTLGEHPETGKAIKAAIGRFGPYVQHEKTFASLPKEDNVLTVGFERAMELIKKKEMRNKPLRILGNHPETKEAIEVREGRYGPYVKHQKTNASLNGQSVESITLEEALELIKAREKTSGKKATKKASKSKAKTSPKTAKAKKKKASTSPKATPEQLAQHLDELEAADAEVVKYLEGMGTDKEDSTAVADRLGLSEEDVKAAHKRAMFKLRMAYGKARKAEQAQA